MVLKLEGGAATSATTETLDVVVAELMELLIVEVEATADVKSGATVDVLDAPEVDEDASSVTKISSCAPSLKP